MSKSLRIVLVDPLGDVLFSGESMNAQQTLVPPPLDDHDEIEDACPPTMRSPTSESGMFVASRYAQDAIDTLPEPTDEIRSSRPRAA